MKFLILSLLVFFCVGAKASYFIPDRSIASKKLVNKTIQTTSASGSYNLTTSLTDIPNLSLNIVGTGKPFIIGLKSTDNPPSLTMLACAVSAATNASITAGGTIVFQDTTGAAFDVAVFPFANIYAASNTGSAIQFPISTAQFFIPTTLGVTRTIKARGILSAGSTGTISGCTMYAYELL